MGTGTVIHGTYTGYNRFGCRCSACTRANSDYTRERYNRLRRRPPTVPQATGLSVTVTQPDDQIERRVTGISGMTSGQVLTVAGVRVWCRNCGASGYANKWIVGNSRRIDHCTECS